MVAFLNSSAFRLPTNHSLLSCHSRRTCGRRRATPSCSDTAPDSQRLSIDSLLDTLRSRNAQTTSPASPPAPTTSLSHVGKVYLVGTGPGDPGLLTLRALYLMSRADVILYDRLVSDSILSFVNPFATLVYVGKEAGFHTRTQQDIHLLLSFFAKSHTTVVRLKGGDPFVFGRGGEETDFLEHCGIRVIAVPGITAASGIAAALAIPLTMRGFATSVRYVTGHLASGSNVDFGAIDDHTTYVVYMGLGQFDSIAIEFVRRGLDQDTPAVGIERGTTPEQRVVSGRLVDLPAFVASAGFKSPTLIIVGRVVSLAPCWAHQGEVLESDDMELCTFTDIEDPVLQRAFKSMDAETQF